MGKILVENKNIVIPGDILAEGMDILPAKGTFREGEKVIALQLGMVNVNKRLIKVVPLHGAYVPKKGDKVIGKIAEVSYSNWFVDVNYAYQAVMSVKEGSRDYIERGADLSNYYDLGDMVYAEIINVTSSMAMDLSVKGPGLRKLSGGKVIEIMPTKIPRIVGKKGSMISMIKKYTDCQIIAAQNGRIWIYGNDPKMERIATETIQFIANNVYRSGLTDKVNELLEKQTGKKVEVSKEEVKNE